MSKCLILISLILMNNPSEQAPSCPHSRIEDWGLEWLNALPKSSIRFAVKLRFEHRLVARRPYHYHDTTLPLCHPDSGLPPAPYFWASSFNSKRSDWLQAQGHQHSAQPSACKLQDQSSETSKVLDKSLNQCWCCGRVASPIWVSVFSSSKCGEHYYGVNCVPPKFIYWRPEVLTLSVMAFGYGTFGRWSGLDDIMSMRSSWWY